MFAVPHSFSDSIAMLCRHFVDNVNCFHSMHGQLRSRGGRIPSPSPLNTMSPLGLLWANCSVRFKNAKSALVAGDAPWTSLGSSRRSPKSLSRLGRGTPVPMPHPLGASILVPLVEAWCLLPLPADLELATVDPGMGPMAIISILRYIAMKFARWQQQLPLTSVWSSSSECGTGDEVCYLRLTCVGGL